MTSAFIIRTPFLGEQRKLEAIGAILEEDYNIKIYTVDADMRRLPVIRDVLRLLILHTRFRRYMRNPALSWIVLRLATSGHKLPKDVEPSIVIATMSAYEVSALLLATSFEAKWIHIGPTKRAWKDLVTLAVCPPAPRSPVSPFVDIQIEPTPVRFSAERGAPGERPAAALLLGQIDVRHWAPLFEIMAAISAKLGVSWIVTTAPRTSRDAEDHVQAKLAEFGDRIPVRQTIWWKPGAPQTKDIVRGAKLVLVTEDSRTMLSDAVATGKPVYLLGHGPYRVEGYNRCLIDSVLSRKRAVRLDVSDCGGFVPDLSIFRPLEECWSSTFRRGLASVLGPAQQPRS